jgi:phenylacetate-CoA ligase
MAVRHPTAGEYWDTLETQSAGERAAFQDRKLRTAITHAYRHAPAARELLDKAGLKPADIRGVADLAKLPVTRKTDVIDRQKVSPPYGGYLAVPAEKVERVFISPGPIYEPNQVASISWFGKAFWAAGFRPGDMVLNAFTYHLSPAGILMHESLRQCGAAVVPTGTGNTEIQLAAMRDLRVNGFIGTPSYLMTLIKRAEELGQEFKSHYFLRRAWFTGEMLAPSVRKTLEGTYGLTTFQAYAVTEPGGAIAYECREHNGLHIMDDYILEIVDPTSGQPVPHGQLGEIVVTPILNPAWGLLRFGTGDLSSVILEGCPCGRTSYRLPGLAGRTGEAVKVRGMFVVARQLEQLMSGLVTSARWQAIVTREGQRDLLTIKCEISKDANAEALGLEVGRKIQEICRVKLDHFEPVAEGSIPSDRKPLADERTWK